MTHRFLIVAGLTGALALQAQEPPEVAAVREYALNYVRGLPDYTCLQETYRIHTIGSKMQTDTIEEELSFVGGGERYKVLKFNGSPAKISHEQLTGAVSTGMFGNLLAHIFDPASVTAFHPAPPTQIDGRAMNVIAYRVPVQKGYIVNDPELHRDLVIAYEGSVWADAETNTVRKLTVKLLNIPKVTRLESTELSLEYKPAELSGQQFILPTQSVWSWRKSARDGLAKEQGTNQVTYKSCRKFTTESNISFDK